MTIRPLLFALVFMSMLYSCTSKDPIKNTSKIEALCKKLVENESTAGLAFGIEIDTLLATTKEFGLANYDTKQFINKHSRFRIASITKPITATAILQLVERNKLSLSDTISTFFPDFPNGNTITVYHLLSHTSGIPDWWEGHMQKNTPTNFPMCPQPHTYIEQMEKMSLFKPGTFFSYSNTGYVLLGEIIELVSNVSYETYLQDNVFVVAGMKNTELEYIERPQENWVSGYTKSESDELTFSAPDSYHMPFAAGGLRSTTHDLLLFLNALESGVLISQDMFIKMTSYATLNNGQAVYESLYTPDGEPPNFPNNIKKYGYGLGFQIIENFGCKTISHGGDIAGFNAVLMYVPHNKVKMTILSNTENAILPSLREIEKLVVSIEI